MAAVVVVATCEAWAQVGTSSVRGTVTDPSGAAVPAATVTASGANNVVKVATTNQQGAYSIVGLPAGKYTVRVLANGFNVAENAIDVAAGASQTVNASLTVVTEKQTVTVTDQLHVDVDPSNNASQLVLKGVDLDVLSDNPDDLQPDLQALAGPRSARMAARSTSTASPAAGCRPRSLSAKFASIRIPSRPNTTSSAMAASRSSPSREPTSFTATRSSISATTSSIRATRWRRRRSLTKRSTGAAISADRWARRRPSSSISTAARLTTTR